MNTLKGLMVKDLLNLKTYAKSIVLMFIFVCFMSIGSQQNIPYVIIMTSVLCGMLVISTFSYDELANTNKFLLTFPINKSEIIKSKYILSIIFAILGAIIGVGIIVGISLIKNEFANIDFESVVVTSLTGLFVNCLMTSIQVPNIIKHGAEKGRIYMFIMMAIIIMLFTGGGYLLNKAGIEINSNGLIKNLIEYIYVILPIAIAVIYGISYKASCGIFAKKEV